MKKIISFLLVAIMILSVFPAISIFAATDELLTNPGFEEDVVVEGETGNNGNIGDKNSNIDVAVSSFELSQANVYMLHEINRIQLLKNALKEVENDYDYIFIDTGSANDQLFLNSINAADLVIPTVKTNFLEINNLSMLET